MVTESNRSGLVSCLTFLRWSYRVCPVEPLRVSSYLAPDPFLSPRPPYLTLQVVSDEEGGKSEVRTRKRSLFKERGCPVYVF